MTEALLNKGKKYRKIRTLQWFKRWNSTKLKDLASKRNIKIFYTGKKIDNSQGVAVYISNMIITKILMRLMKNLLES